MGFLKRNNIKIFIAQRLEDVKSFIIVSQTLHIERSEIQHGEDYENFKNCKTRVCELLKNLISEIEYIVATFYQNGSEAGTVISWFEKSSKIFASKSPKILFEKSPLSVPFPPA